MSINGVGGELVINGGKLRVAGGIVVNGSVSYGENATGLGGVTAQIDNDNTLTISASKLSGVAKIDRNTGADITSINHTNVTNNTTIHIALKNTSENKHEFITIDTFVEDTTVKVNYTSEYVITPGETGMLTLRKVDGILSIFIREMFSSTAADFENSNSNPPFYIKNGVNYTYPLYTYSGTGLEIQTINGTQYYRPTTGLKIKSQPPKGIPENGTLPSVSEFKIGNDGDLTTLEYDVFGVSSNFDYGSISNDDGTTRARFILTNGEASGTFTESGISSGDSYKLYIEKLDTGLTDTVTATSTTPVSPYAVFHHNTFANGGDPYGHGSVTAAAAAGYFYSNTPIGTYTLGTLDEDPTFVQEIASQSGTGSTIRDGDAKGKTTYKFTFFDLTDVDHLLIAGGGGGGGGMGGGGGAGGYLETKGTTLSGQKIIQVGGGGVGGHEQDGYQNRGRNGANTSVTGLTTAIGGGGGASDHNESHMPAGNGGSGGGGSGGLASNGNYGGERGTGTPGQGFDGARSGQTWYPGGGGGASEKGYGRDGTSPSNTTIGHGGNGKQSTITGFTNYWFAGGGGAAGHDNSGGNGGKGGGGGGARHQSQFSHGTGDTNGLTNGETGDDGTPSDTQEPPANTAGGAGGKHTGGGGGGGDHHTHNWGGVGGSGIVIIRTGGNLTTGKTIPKVKDIVIDPTNESNVLISTQGTGISTVTYSVNSGSEVSTPVSQLSVAHGLAEATTGTLLAYALDASSARLGVKLSKSITAVYGYETFTITRHSTAGTTLSITGNGTDNITSVYKNSGSNGWDTGFYTPTFTAPITFEFNKTAASSDNSVSYIQIGITDTPTTTAASGNQSSNTDYYFYSYYTSAYNIGSGKGLSTSNGSSWDINKKHYIVYKTNGDLEFWNGNDLKYSVPSWGMGKTVRFETSHHINSSTLTNQMTNLRLKRREWDGTKYIN